MSFVSNNLSRLCEFTVYNLFPIAKVSIQVKPNDSVEEHDMTTSQAV